MLADVRNPVWLGEFKRRHYREIMTFDIEMTV